MEVVDQVGYYGRQRSKLNYEYPIHELCVEEHS